MPGDVQWVFRGDRGLTWMREPRAVDKITAGEWWPPDYDGAPLVSLHDEIGRALGIGPGDKLTINILGRDVEVTIANLREVDWSNLSINFRSVERRGGKECVSTCRSRWSSLLTKKHE